MQVIGKLAGNPNQACAAVQLAVVIADVDGEFTPDEQRGTPETAYALNLGSAEGSLS